MAVEKLRNRDDSVDRSELPVFPVVPPVRCSRLRLEGEPGVCGEIASWRTPSKNAWPEDFACNAHHRPGDLPLPPATLFRRVRISLAIDFAGISLNAGVAHREALARLEQAVQAAGGLLNVLHVGSTVGRGCPPPAPGKVEHFTDLG